MKVTACAGDVIRRRIERRQLTAALAMEDPRIEEIGVTVLLSCNPPGLLIREHQHAA